MPVARVAMIYSSSCKAKFPLKKFVCQKQCLNRSKPIAATKCYHFYFGALQFVRVRRG